MSWSWRGRAGKGAGGRAGLVPAARPAGPPPVSPAGWAFLPPLQRVIGDAPATTAPRAFPQQLPAWRDPSFTGRMTHVVSPVAPAGIVDADGGGLGAPSVRASTNELTLLLPAAPVQRQAERHVPQVASIARPTVPVPAAHLTTTDPARLPVLQLVALPADEQPPPDELPPPGPTDPVAPEPLPYAQLLTEPESHEPAPRVLESGYDNGGATTVQLPMPPVQRSAAGPVPAAGRTPGAGPRPRLGLGAPLPPGPPPAAEPPVLRVVTAAVAGAAAPAPEGTGPAAPAGAPANSGDFAPRPGESAPDPAMEPPAGSLVPVEQATGSQPPVPMALAVQRSTDEQPGAADLPEPAAPAPQAESPAAAPTAPPAGPPIPPPTAPPVPPPTPPSGEPAQAALLGERELAAPAPAALGPLAGRGSGPALPTAGSGPGASPVAPSPAPGAPTLPLQRATSPAASRDTPAAASVAAAPVGQGPEPPQPQVIAVQRDVGVLAQRSLVPLVSAEISPTAPAVRTRTAERAAPLVQPRPAVPITLLPPIALAAPEPHVATLTAQLVQRAAPAPAPRPAASPASTGARTAANHAGPAAAVELPLGAYPPAASIQRAAADETPAAPEPPPESDSPPPDDVQPDAAAPSDDVAAGSPPPAAVPATGAAGTGTAESAPSQEQLDELARRLMPPLTRRLRAEMLIDRERRGLRSDPR